MLDQLRNRKFYLVLSADILIFILAFVEAYLLRFDFVLEPFYRTQIINLLPIFLPGKVLIFFLFGMYRGMWRFTGLDDLWRLLQATVLSMLFYIATSIWVIGLERHPRSVFLIDAVLTFIMSGGLRMGIRFCYGALKGSERWSFKSAKEGGSRPQSKSILIVGAGGAGEKMLREIFDNPHLNYRVVGFLDDDQTKWCRTLHGLKVFGGMEKLSQLLKTERIDEVLIATPSATGAQMRRILEICKDCEVRYRTLPEIGAIIDGKLSIKNLRDVKYEDLQRRPPVRLDTTEISRYLGGKRVLVTGAGGSIGSGLCRQIIRFGPQELIMLDASEANLFNIQMELLHELKFPANQAILGRVQNRRLMDEVS